MAEEIIVEFRLAATVQLPEAAEKSITDDNGDLLPEAKNRAVGAVFGTLPESGGVYLDGAGKQRTIVYFDIGSVELEEISVEEEGG